MWLFACQKVSSLISLGYRFDTQSRRGFLGTTTRSGAMESGKVRCLQKESSLEFDALFEKKKLFQMQFSKTTERVTNETINYTVFRLFYSGCGFCVLTGNLITLFGGQKTNISVTSMTRCSHWMTQHQWSQFREALEYRL